ncbi:hypothetical protein Pelo_17591 [Pelomyxa schiedti]|nr:hypothetical protein Pelo_17591 [Pelomyxa schiedti]
MDSWTSVHIIKTACHVVVAVFVRPAALCADHYLRCLILTSEPRKQGRVRVLCGSTQKQHMLPDNLETTLAESCPGHILTKVFIAHRPSTLCQFQGQQHGPLSSPHPPPPPCTYTLMHPRTASNSSIISPRISGWGYTLWKGASFTHTWHPVYRTAQTHLHPRLMISEMSWQF